jgi:hypothetical protein
MLMKPLSCCCAVLGVAVSAVLFSGCGGGKSQWEITVENKGTSPCSVYVTMDYVNRSGQGNSEARIDDLAAGKSLKLISGTLDTTIRSVKVVRGEDEQELKPNVELLPGRQYQIVVTADGKIDASMAAGN